jgi:hypothetical protein
LPAPWCNLAVRKKEMLVRILIKFKSKSSFLPSPLKLLPGSRLEACAPSDWTAGILPALWCNLAVRKKEMLVEILIKFKSYMSCLLSPLKLLPGSRLEACVPRDWTAGILPALWCNLAVRKKEMLVEILIKFKSYTSCLLSPLKLLPGSRLEACVPRDWTAGILPAPG